MENKLSTACGPGPLQQKRHNVILRQTFASGDVSFECNVTRTGCEQGAKERLKEKNGVYEREQVK